MASNIRISISVSVGIRIALLIDISLLSKNLLIYIILQMLQSDFLRYSLSIRQ